MDFSKFVPIFEEGFGEHSDVANIAKKAWNLGKKLGMISKEGDVEVEERLRALEVRGGGGQGATV